MFRVLVVMHLTKVVLLFSSIGETLCSFICHPSIYKPAHAELGNWGSLGLKRHEPLKCKRVRGIELQGYGKFLAITR